MVRGTIGDRGMVVERLKLRGFRNLRDGELPLSAGMTAAVGANGAGKTNLLEGLYFALTGHSCRTSNEREVIRFGESLARVEATIADSGERRTFSCAIERGGERRHSLDGSSPAAATELRPAVAVFMPDRLALVKGAPAARRAHLDRLVAALWPGRAEVRRRFGRALAQRNALLARIRGGLATAAALDAWDLELAREAIEVIEARRRAVELLREPFEQAAAALGLPGRAALSYRPRTEASDSDQLAAELRARRQSDIDRGRGTHGPQYDEVVLSLADRPLRRYGSQGQQRMALLALLFAEREAILAERGAAPIMLLDDVMSELDPERRELLVSRLATSGQTLITATHSGQLPDCPRTEITVRDGQIDAAAKGGGADPAPRSPGSRASTGETGDRADETRAAA